MMVGQSTVTNKPSRSDEVLDADEQIKIANQIRAQFDALAPKRPIKPNRSEPDAAHPVHSTLSAHDIPEFDKFQSLQSQSQSHDILSKEGCVNVQDEFVETDYYNKLVSIDKQHHATGTGFIKVVREGGYEIHLPENHADTAETNLKEYKSNPATNDWVPNIDENDRVFVSSKPNRSESS